MSYPQPSSNDYAVRGVQYFRLLTPLATPGDIYESEQSCHALALGPESDVANVDLAYFDDQMPTFVAQTQVGPPRSVTGRIDARNTDSYAPSGRPGRILFWPSDLYDPTFIPSGLNIGTDTLTFITPVLDVIQYFKPQQSLVPVRNDKTFRFTEVVGTAPGSTFIVLPYWGRKYASCSVLNGTASNIHWRVISVSYFVNPNNQAIENIVDTQILAAGTKHVSVVRAAVNGMFDALMIEVDTSTTPGPTPFVVTMSDTPA